VKSSNLSDITINDGLKEALNIGVQYATKELGASNGYLNNAAVKIPLPKNIQKVEKLIRKSGGDKVADNLIQSMNDAASQAVPQTKEILFNSIKKMNIKDAQQILSGKEDAATSYFKQNSSTELKAMIMPIIKKSISNNNVATYYNKANSFYKSNLSKYANSSSVMGVAKKLGADSYIPSKDSLNIDDYVANKTLDGLFLMISKKESAIRSNPKEQITSILKQVFSK
jgi:hypothetical protein